MTRGQDERDSIAEGRKGLTARLDAELKQADDEGSVEQFLEAEATIEEYLDAVAECSVSLPNSPELAFACAILLITTETLEERDLELLGRLNAPTAGVSLYAVSGQIADMKARAIAAL